MNSYWMALLLIPTRHPQQTALMNSLHTCMICGIHCFLWSIWIFVRLSLRKIRGPSKPHAHHSLLKEWQFFLLLLEILILVLELFSDVSEPPRFGESDVLFLLTLAWYELPFLLGWGGIWWLGDAPDSFIESSCMPHPLSFNRVVWTSLILFFAPGF